MIIGIKNASHLHQLEKVTIKPILFILLMVGTLTPQAADSLDFEMPVFSFTPKVFHHPDRVFFNTRAFELEVFANFPKEDIRLVSLFYKTDTMPRYIEFPFDLEEKRFAFRYDPREKPAKKITYFFSVGLKNGSLYATPVDTTGNLSPITKNLLDPREYFKKRASLRN